jgi:Flp pilus assembly protein TadG
MELPNHLPSSILHRALSRRAAIVARLREDTGSALIELAVVLSLLGVPLLLGTIYTSVLILDYSEITNGAHTGALYAMRSSTWAEDTTGIAAAAQADASDIGANLTVTSSIYYVCSGSQDGTQYTLQTDASAACNGGSSHTLEFVQVVASAPITPPATFPGMPKSMTLSSTSAMEVEE